MGRFRARFVTGQKGYARDGFDRVGRKDDDLPTSDRMTTVVDLEGLWLVRCNCGWHEKTLSEDEALRIRANHKHRRK